VGTDLLTFTVITTDPNEVVQPMHDRMPVILPAKDYDRWLKADPERPPIDLLRPFDAGKMVAWKVDQKVGNVRNDSPELIEEAATPPCPKPCFLTKRGMSITPLSQAPAS
jgi:putative SOS response-associated peptidase YedK